MNQIQIRSFNERFNECFIHCENDLRKMSTEGKHLKDQEHADADVYQFRINELQDRYQLLKTEIINGLNAPKTTVKSAAINDQGSKLEKLKSYLTWVNKKTSDIQTESYPEELFDVEQELERKNEMLKEIKTFRESYFKEFIINENSQEKLKYSLNELEIAFNLLFNETNHRIKCLQQLKDLVEAVNNELSVLDKFEEVELNRDWSSPNKLDSFELQKFHVVTNFRFLF